MAHVSWQCPQSKDIEVTGYNVLIDGKQYGNPMHEGVKTVRIKVGSSLLIDVAEYLLRRNNFTNKQRKKIFGYKMIILNMSRVVANLKNSKTRKFEKLK